MQQQNVRVVRIEDEKDQALWNDQHARPFVIQGLIEQAKDMGFRALSVVDMSGETLLTREFQSRVTDRLAFIQQGLAQHLEGVEHLKQMLNRVAEAHAAGDDEAARVALESAMAIETQLLGSAHFSEDGVLLEELGFFKQPKEGS